MPCSIYMYSSNFCARICILKVPQICYSQKRTCFIDHGHMYHVNGRVCEFSFVEILMPLNSSRLVWSSRFAKSFWKWGSRRKHKTCCFESHSNLGDWNTCEIFYCAPIFGVRMSFIAWSMLFHLLKHGSHPAVKIWLFFPQKPIFNIQERRVFSSGKAAFWFKRLWY